jgi:hypothetical protein
VITDSDRQALMVAKRRFRAWVEHMGTSIGRVSHPQHTGELMGDPQFFYFQQYVNVRTLPEPQTDSDLQEQLLALGDRGARAMDIYKDRHPEWARYTSALAEHYFPKLFTSWARVTGSYEQSSLMNQVGRYTYVIARLATADMVSWHVFHEWISTFENEQINRRYAHLDDFDRAYGPHIVDTLYCVHGTRDWVIFMRLLDDDTIVVINYKPGPTGVAVIPVSEVAEMPIIQDFKWHHRPPGDPHSFPNHFAP